MNAGMDLLNHDFVQIVTATLQVLASLLIFALGTGLIAVLIMYVIDKRQTSHTIRRNYPVIGRFRYAFEHIGKFFRPYFFAGTGRRCPLTGHSEPGSTVRLKNVDRTVAFGSTKPITR